MPYITFDEVPDLVEKRLTARDERNEAFEIFAAAREQAGLKTDESDYTTLCAADLRKLAQDFANATKSGGLDYSSTGSKTCAVGSYDPKTKNWI